MVQVAKMVSPDYLIEINAIAALDDAGMTTSGVDWVVAHQANKRILDQVALRLETRSDRMLCNIDRVGNTSSASIPIDQQNADKAKTIINPDRAARSATLD